MEVMEHLKATHAFLGVNLPVVGVTEFASLSNTQAQCFVAHLKADVQKRGSALGLEEATRLVESVVAGPWKEEGKNFLISQINELTSSAHYQDMKVAPNSLAMQHCLEPYLYPTSELWGKLTSGQGADAQMKMMAFIRFMMDLGLRCPTEKTIQCCVGVLLFAIYGLEDALQMDPATKLSMLQDFKERFKIEAKQRGAPRERITNYPASPTALRESHPATYEAVYGSAGPVVWPVDTAKLGELIRSVPMRRTKAAAQTGRAPPQLDLGGNSMMQAAGQVLQQVQNMGIFAAHTIYFLPFSHLPSPLLPFPFLLCPSPMSPPFLPPSFPSPKT